MFTVFEIFTVFLGFIPIVKCNLKFVALGNFGFGPDVYNIVNQVKLREYPSFIISPGSNFQGGITSFDDNKYVEYFKKPMSDSAARLRLPFFSVLGVDDWTGNPEAQINTRRAVKNYTDYMKVEDDKEDPYSTAPVWFTPNWWYHWVQHYTATRPAGAMGSGHGDVAVGFYMLDTFVVQDSFPYPDMTKRARDDFETFIEHGRKIFDFIIVVGDRPIHQITESTSSLQEWLDPLFEKGDVDLYLAGRDFVMEATEFNGTLHLQCGSSSRSLLLNRTFLSKKVNEDNKFYSGELGYCSFDFGLDEFVVEFISPDGKVLKSIKRLRRPRNNRDYVSPYTHFAKLPEVEYVPLPPDHVSTGDALAFVQIVGSIGLGISLIFLFMTMGFIGSKQC